MFPGGRRWRPHDTAVLLVLCVAFGAAFAPVLLGERSFFHYDLFTEHVPVWHAVQGALLSGENPFWLDGQYGGNPLLYHQETPLFYPPTIPLLLTGGPAYRLADLFSLFHFLLAGLLAARLVKEETGHSGAAALGGVAWMLSTRTVHCALWPNAVAVAALVPGLLLGLLRIGRGERRSGVVLSSLFGGLLGLTARPQAVIGFLPAIAACAVLVLVRSAFRKQAAKDLALSFLVAAAVSAPSVVPTVLLHPEMERAAGLTRADRNTSAVSGATVRIVFLPGERQTDSPEAASHPGFAAWVLLAAAFVFGRGNRDLAVALGIAGSVGFVFAFGDSGPYRLLTGLPLLDSLRAPSRFLLSWSLFLALGAALGAAALARRYPRNRFLVPGAILLLGADLVFHARTTAPTVPADCYRVMPRFARMLTGRPLDPSGFPYRHWTVGTALPDARAPGITSADIEREARLPGAIGLRFGLESLEGGGPALGRTRQFMKDGFPRAARFAAVDTVFVPDTVYRVAEPFPRAYVVPDAVPVGSADALRVLLSPRFDAKRTAILEPHAAPALGGWDPSRGSVRLVGRKPGRIRLEAELPGPGFLVLLDSFAQGWTATVDDVTTPILPANVAFRAVALHAGRHAVEMRYRPPGVLAGLGVALHGLLLLFLWARRPDLSRPNSG